MKFSLQSLSINELRRKAMYAITRNVGSSVSLDFNNLSELENVKKILVLRPNHRLGNLILTTPIIAELSHVFPNSKIDILIRGDYLAPIVFGKYEKINNYLPLPRKPFNSLIKYASLWGKVKVKEYDLVINAVEGSSSGRLLTKLSRAEYKVFGGTSEETPIEFKHRKHIALGPIYDLRYFLRNIREFNDKNIPLLDIKLTTEEKSKGKLALKKIVKTDKPVIGIFTFATGAKCYSTEFWDEFYTKLKAKFTAYQILEILPIENVSQIQFREKTYYSKDIREIASVMHNTEIFIGADSGMMHLASASLTPTVGLFSKANIEEYKPYGPQNTAINTNTTSIDDSLKIIERILDS
ncbi:glycosyltransferase family 9 protein [Psychroserpens sp. Hel_I_66]|uniref:glycosyltransferase family 9 protein n=1 Tax=Psychroserpens sp. Hel_I_66 TaxID=1250004 RepID=UPI0006468FCD|nr:glycosyltransferase family 9 protein [Psychroserpens sp. Hel_I_66]